MTFAFLFFFSSTEKLLLQSSKKRKLSVDRYESTANSTCKDFSCNASTSSNYSMNMSTWEQRRMKADLMEAETRIMNLKSEVERQHKLYAEKEIDFEQQLKSLKQDNEFNTEKIAELDRHLKAVRKRERAANAEKIAVQGEFSRVKTELEDQIFKLQQENTDAKSTAKSIESDLLNEISEQQRTIYELETELQCKKVEIKQLTQYKTDVEEKVEGYKIIQAALEQERFNVIQAQNKVLLLENQVASYGDYKELSANFKEKLLKFCEYERENERLTRTNKRLNDLISNQLLAEEKINSLKMQLKNHEKEHTELIELRVRYASLEEKLSAWVAVGKYFLPGDDSPAPDELKSKFESILGRDLELMNESSTAKSDRSIIELQHDEAKSRNEVLKKQADDLQRGLKHHQTILSRLQKKLQLVVRERDAYKQLLDNYEKDLTISATASSSNDTTLRFKIETLEKSVAGYKELCAKMESELEAAQSTPDLAQISLLGNEHYSNMRRELEDIRIDNERLRRRKDELELELETKCVRAALLDEPMQARAVLTGGHGDGDAEGGRILHLADNPADEAHKEHVVQVEKLQAEIEMLREKIGKLEEGNAELTMRLQDETLVTNNIKEREALQKKLKSLEAKNHHLKEVYKTMSQEFREVCYMLFGYRVDRIGNQRYRISSMYAESADDYLSFRLNDEGVLDMLETEYSEQLNDFMATHLANHNSLPAFLSSLTLELFKRTTICL